MSFHPIHLSILLGVLLISAWEPVIGGLDVSTVLGCFLYLARSLNKLFCLPAGIEAVPQPSPSTTWQVG